MHLLTERSHSFVGGGTVRLSTARPLSPAVGGWRLTRTGQAAPSEEPTTTSASAGGRRAQDPRSVPPGAAVGRGRYPLVARRISRAAVRPLQPLRVARGWAPAPVCH